MGLENINWLGSLAAAIAAFVVGAIWYSPVAFAKSWQSATGLSDEQLSGGNVPMLFGLAFLMMLLAAIGFSKLLGPDPSVQAGVCWGVVVAVLLASTFLGVHYLFERRPLKLWLINTGFNTVSFVIYGVVLGLWP